MKRKMMKKVLVMVLALTMVCVASVAGTLAYLTHQTAKVTNTFVIGSLFSNPSVDFALLEHELDDDGVGVNGVFKLTETLVTSNEYKNVLPGVDVIKDPFVRVNGLKEDAYLFLVVDDNTGEHINATVDDTKWFYYKDDTSGNAIYVYNAEGNYEMKASTAQQNIGILTGNTVTVSKDFAGGSGIDISFTAYIIQSAGLADYTAAWDAINS